MKKTKLLLYLIIMLSVSMMLWGCKSDGDAQEELENGSVIKDIIEAAAKYVGYNTTKDTHPKGVNKISIQGTQAFDKYYYGFDADTKYFLENSSKTISYYQTVSDPSPENELETSFNSAFADGTFADKLAYSGKMHPVPVTARTETNYNGSGTALNSNSYWKWAIEYDSTTGNPTTFTRTYTSAATGNPLTMANARYVYTYAANSIDPDFNNYSKTSEAVYSYDGSTFTRTWKKTISKTGTSSWTAENTTETTTCYGADDDTKATTCGLSSSAHQTVETKVLSGTSKTTTTKYYNTSGVEFGRKVESYEYASVARFHEKTTSEKQYSVASDGTATLTYQQDKAYTNGFQTGQTNYSVTAGTATMSSTETWTKDSQGRSTDYIQKDANGIPTKHLVYTFDSNGTRTSLREYGYTSGVQNTTPECVWGYNYDWTFSRDSAGVVSVSMKKYCNGSTYVSTGYERNDVVYNKGLQTSYKQYLYNGTTTATLNSQASYEYDDNGNRTKMQYYSVSGGTATAADYYTYSYDDNLYKVTTKKYNSSDELQLVGGGGSCAANTSGTCYTTVSYSYK